SLSTVVTGLNSATSLVTSIASGTVGAITSILDSFSKESEAIDAISKLATRSGFSTEFLSALSHGANLAGTDFESLSAALTKMEVNLAKFATSDDDPLREIGLSAQQLMAIKPDEAFGRIADGINALPT